jgi:hypothetical protein
MSESRIPFTLGDLKSVGDRLEDNIGRVNAALGPNAIANFSLEVVPGPGEPSTSAGRQLSQMLRESSKPPRRQRRKAAPDTYTPIEHTLYSLQAFGFTHPSNGRYLMVPKEFQAILLLETKAVAAVVWEVMQQTIGWEGNGPGGRREWAPLTVRHFERARILSHKHARKGIADALKAGYIERRQRGARRYEYRLRWKGTN